VLPTEEQARQNRRNQAPRAPQSADPVPANPFPVVAVENAPLLPEAIRAQQPAAGGHTRAPRRRQPVRAPAPRPADRILVWQKVLPRTDALQVPEGTHHVGGVRLTQARFESPPGHLIDQTTYFRNLFAEFHWEQEPGRYRDQEHALVPMRVFIRGHDFGILNFELSHKPSGEAGQANYTTILRWGRDFNPTIERENVTGLILSLYETPNADAPFLLDLTERP
jgi:hypothetical protein